MKDEIAYLNREAHRSKARRNLGLDPQKPTVIVTGGSLGAQSLNNAVAACRDHFAEWGLPDSAYYR